MTINCQAKTPPATEDNTFNGVSKAECVLNVPEGSGDLYREAYEWKDFENIKEAVFPDSKLDVNNDGKTDVEDLNLVLNTILKLDQVSNADVSGDGKVDIYDLNKVIDAILNK